MARKKGQEHEGKYLPGFAPTLSSMSDETRYRTKDGRKKWRPQRPTAEQKKDAWNGWKLYGHISQGTSVDISAGDMRIMSEAPTPVDVVVENYHDYLPTRPKRGDVLNITGLAKMAALAKEVLRKK